MTQLLTISQAAQRLGLSPRTVPHD